MKHGRQGFTLIEITVVSVITVIMSAAIFAVMARGLDIWRRSESLGASQNEAVFALEKASRELRSSFAYPGIPFDGNSGSISFASLIDTAGPAEGPSYAVGSIVYFYKPEDRTLYRSPRAYSELLSKEAQKAEPVIKDVEKFGIQYLVPDPKDTKPVWAEKPAGQDRRPRGVRFLLITKKGPDEHSFKRTVYFPTAR